MVYDIPVIDSHVHYAWPITAGSLTDVLQKTNTDQVCLAALSGQARLDPTLDILVYKHRHPDTTFALGCLDCTVYETQDEIGVAFVKHAKRILEMGCDGIKLLEGKPTMRRAFPIPDFDDAVWEPFWAFCEQLQVPLLWHVNDPEEFWDPQRVPAFAASCGWGYGPDDVDNEAQYRQVRNVLERHPDLNVTLAHMFFMSAQLPRLSEWMERFPHLHVDLTPGIELYEHLSETYDETQKFFAHFPDRILYGTDIGGRAVLNGTQMKLNERESLLRVQYTRTFLTERTSAGVRADGDFLIHSEPFVLHGLGLKHDALKKILHDNFLSFIGCEKPWPVNVPFALKECARLRRVLREDARRLDIAPDLRAVESAKRYFEKAKANPV